MGLILQNFSLVICFLTLFFCFFSAIRRKFEKVLEKTLTESLQAGGAQLDCFGISKNC